MSNVRIVVVRGDARLELEGEQAFVESHLKQLLPVIDAQEPAVRQKPGKSDSGETETLAGKQTRQSLPTFLEAKKPQNVYEAIAAVLYHRGKAEAKDEFSGAEIRDSLVQGRYRPPGSMAQTLTDCRRRYGYIQPGTKKGLWKLTHTGETAVEFDLPRKEK